MSLNLIRQRLGVPSPLSQALVNESVSLLLNQECHRLYTNQ